MGEDDGQARAGLELVRAGRPEALPSWAAHDELRRFFHEKMRPWHDTVEDVGRGLDYAFGEGASPGGFVLVAGLEGRLVGGAAVLRTGMRGFVPENLLLFIAVEPGLRGRGIGRALMDRLVEECDGAVKLHVEPENPARHLYERCGFEPKYLEMRRRP